MILQHKKDAEMVAASHFRYFCTYDAFHIGTHVNKFGTTRDALEDTSRSSTYASCLSVIASATCLPERKSS